MNNLGKIRNIVNELTIRDEKLIEKSKILEELFLKSPQAIAIMEKDWKYVLVNELFATLYGFECPTQMVGKCHYELFKSIPERPIDEINIGLTEKGLWKGTIKCPHKSNDSFLCEVIIKSVEEKDMLVWTCVKVNG
jgi:PAS domain-containing protein|tara:strand:+ start:118 stop:525 length:408 start_codon:yes stop_codon:yes gene_type:complete